MFTTFAFWPPAFHLAPLNDFPARLAAQIPCFQNSQLTADFCALQHRPVEPRRCDMSGDDFHKTKQADQSLRRARSGHLSCVILRQGPADQERHDRKEAAHTPFLVFVRCEGSTISLFFYYNTDFADLKADLKVGPATRINKSASCNASEHTGVTVLHVDLFYSPSLCRRASRASAIDLLW